ncbi:FluC/FEX family fluoride channel [Halomonas denitrificans]|nr:CrcB family protein [Halomonas denitrificans]
MPGSSDALTACLVIAAGSALGGMARYLLVAAAEARRTDPRWPLGTLIVNLLGCLLLGMVAAPSSIAAPATLRLGLVAGLGSFTTVSAFVLESWQRRATRRVWVGYGLVTVLGCLFMFRLGQGLA